MDAKINSNCENGTFSGTMIMISERSQLLQAFTCISDRNFFPNRMCFWYTQRQKYYCLHYIQIYCIWEQCLFYISINSYKINLTISIYVHLILLGLYYLYITLYHILYSGNKIETSFLDHVKVSLTLRRNFFRDFRHKISHILFVMICHLVGPVYDR